MGRNQRMEGKERMGREEIRDEKGSRRKKM